MAVRTSTLGEDANEALHFIEVDSTAVIDRCPGFAGTYGWVAVSPRVAAHCHDGKHVSGD
jgi:hypothetical protein